MSLQDGSDVTVEVATGGAAGSSEAAEPADHGAAAGVAIRSQSWCGGYAVSTDGFSLATVGAKSLNTVRLQVLSSCLLCRVLLKLQLTEAADVMMTVTLEPAHPSH